MSLHIIEARATVDSGAIAACRREVMSKMSGPIFFPFKTPLQTASMNGNYAPKVLPNCYRATRRKWRQTCWPLNLRSSHLMGKGSNISKPKDSVDFRLPPELSRLLAWGLQVNKAVTENLVLAGGAEIINGATQPLFQYQDPPTRAFLDIEGHDRSNIGRCK